MGLAKRNSLALLRRHKLNEISKNDKSWNELIELHKKEVLSDYFFYRPIVEGEGRFSYSDIMNMDFDELWKANAIITMVQDLQREAIEKAKAEAENSRR